MEQHEQNDIIWYDSSTVGEKVEEGKTNIKLIKVLNDEAKDLRDQMDSFYNDAQQYERVYQYRSSRDKKNDRSVDSGFHVEKSNTLTFNLIRACCNAAHNKIAKVTPKITFLTKDADREKREVAKKMDTWIFKLFKKTMVYKETAMAFLEACVCGLGVLKQFFEDNKIVFRKISCFEFFCDYAFKGASTPKTAGDVKELTVYELKQLFPAHKAVIQEIHGKNKDKVEVIEMYREKKKKAIFTDKILLLYEDWDKRLPYVTLKWTEANSGVVGVALAKEVWYIQQTITYILDKMMKGLHRFAVPRVLLEKGSDPQAVDIGNIVGEIIEYNKGVEKPIFIAPPVMNEQVIKILLLLWEKGFEVSGMSQLQAHGQIPSGLKQASGTALRTYNQIESERFQLVRKDYDNIFIQLTKLVLESCSDSQLPEGLTKKDIKEAKEHISIFSSNILPETPAGRHALVSEMMSSNLITRSQALSLIQSPDTDRLLSSESDRISAIEIELDRAVQSGNLPDMAASSVLGIEEYLDRARKLYAKIVIEEGADSDKLIVLSKIYDLVGKKQEQQAQMNAMSQQGGDASNQMNNPQKTNLNLP